tara:strand:- start:3118 stop:3363 length:246 start_codon:yes stop_codon:yes gene_type:complete
MIEDSIGKMVMLLYDRTCVVLSSSHQPSEVIKAQRGSLGLILERHESSFDSQNNQYSTARFRALICGKIVVLFETDYEVIQ